MKNTTVSPEELQARSGVGVTPRTAEGCPRRTTDGAYPSGLEVYSGGYEGGARTPPLHVCGGAPLRESDGGIPLLSPPTDAGGGGGGRVRGGRGAEPPDEQASLISTIGHSTTCCIPKQMFFWCYDCRKMWTKDSGCMAMSCTRCAPAVTARRARKAHARLDAGRKGRPVLYTVLTVPPAMRAKFTDRKAWRAALRRMWKSMEKEFGALYGVEGSHPIGKDTEVFHPHANFLWVQRSGFRYMLDTNRLRELWAKAIGCRGVVDVHTQFMTTDAKVAHRVRYALRTFPGFQGWTGSIRWYGSYPPMPKDDDGGGAVRCPDCGGDMTMATPLMYNLHHLDAQPLTQDSS